MNDALVATLRKSRLAMQAKETLRACEWGFYENPHGIRVVFGELIEQMLTDTHAYDHPPPVNDPPVHPPSRLMLTHETTLAALQWLKRDGDHLGCLNFASARRPGGGFLNGAQAQEESLARSSALYLSLLAQPQFYEANLACGTSLYLHRAIFSGQVPFVRDDQGTWLLAPLTASVITCPAPNLPALDTPIDPARLYPILWERAALILAIAHHHRIDTLVLGAWGAGVFGNDPKVIAQIFQRLLTSPRFATAFRRVVFAVIGDRELKAFTEVLG